jgi:menaquinone-dependent protoporphyrinogen oxidase
MNTLIAYGTKYGCAEKCAIELSNELDGKVDTVNLKENNKIELAKYDRVIIGGSAYIGKIQKEVTDFINLNLNELLKKEIGLFICGMQEGEELKKEIAENFPEQLLEKAKSVKHFGGEFIFRKMNFLERAIVKKISKVTSDKSDIKHDNIKKLAIELSNRN